MRRVPPTVGRRTFLAAGACALVASDRVRAETAGHALEVMGNPYNADTYSQLAKSFERSPSGEALNVTFSPREGDEIVRSLLLRAFTDAALPDVAFLNGDVIRTFGERGLLQPLDSSLRGAGAGPMRPVRIGAASYGVAFGLSVPIVAFNSALLRRAGEDPQRLPSDWPGVVALARRIQAAAPEVTGGFIEHDNGGAFTFLYLLGSYGIKPMSADEQQLGFDSPAGVRALQVLREFGECGQASVDMSRRQARRAFASGRIGVLVTMSSVVPYLQKNSAGDFEVLVTPLPLADADAQIPSAGPVAVLFAKDPARQRRAWQFLQYAAGAEGQTLLASTSGYLPASDLPARTLPPARQLASLVDPRRVTPWYTFPGRNSLKISQLIQDQMQQVATLQKRPEIALRDIVRAVRPLLARRG